MIMGWQFCKLRIVGTTPLWDIITPDPIIVEPEPLGKIYFWEPPN